MLLLLLLPYFTVIIGIYLIVIVSVSLGNSSNNKNSNRLLWNERLRQQTRSSKLKLKLRDSPHANASDCLSIYLNVLIANNCLCRATFDFEWKIFIIATLLLLFMIYIHCISSAFGWKEPTRSRKDLLMALACVRNSMPLSEWPSRVTSPPPRLSHTQVATVAWCVCVCVWCKFHGRRRFVNAAPH